MNDAVLVIGAQSEIGQSLIAKVIAEEKTSQVIAVSRSACPSSLASRVLDEARLTWMRCDYSDQEMAAVVERWFL